MRSLLKYFVFGLVIFMTGTEVKAQNALLMQVGYELNIPTSSFRNYITNPAFKGFTAGIAYPFNDQFSLGLHVGYNDYYQKYGRQVYDEGKGTAISAVVSNSIQQLPIVISANYTLLKKGFIRPYIGAGGGLNIISFDQYLGEFDNPQSMAKPTVEGEAGVFIPLSTYSPTALKIGASYHYAPFSSGQNLNTWGIQAGIRFVLR